MAAKHTFASLVTLAGVRARRLVTSVTEKTAQLVARVRSDISDHTPSAPVAPSQFCTAFDVATDVVSHCTSPAATPVHPEPAVASVVSTDDTQSARDKRPAVCCSSGDDLCHEGNYSTFSSFERLPVNCTQPHCTPTHVTANDMFSPRIFQDEELVSFCRDRETAKSQPEASPQPSHVLNNEFLCSLKSDLLTEINRGLDKMFETISAQISSDIERQTNTILDNVRELIKNSEESRMRYIKHNHDACIEKLKLHDNVVQEMTCEISALRAEVEHLRSVSMTNDAVNSHIDVNCTSGSAYFPSNTHIFTPFTGVEQWHVWFNRFKTVGANLNWSESDFHRELMPLLQGNAGVFVYSELSESDRQNYEVLVSQLSSRFDDFGISEQYEMEFAARQIRDGETFKEYMVALRSLYTRAWPKDSRAERRSKVVGRFISGIGDNDIARWIKVHAPNCSEDKCVEFATRIVAVNSQFDVAQEAVPCRISHYESNGQTNQQKKSRNYKSYVICYICKSPGHKASKCRRNVLPVSPGSQQVPNSLHHVAPSAAFQPHLAAVDSQSFAPHPS